MQSKDIFVNVMRDHDGLAVNLTTPKQFTRNKGWLLDCTCGKSMGDQGDEDDAWENYRAHVAEEVLSALGIMSGAVETTMRDSRRWRRYITKWAEVLD